MKLTQRIVLGYYRNKFRLLELFSAILAAKEVFEPFCTPYSRRKSYEAAETFKSATWLSFSFQEHLIAGLRGDLEYQMDLKFDSPRFDDLSSGFER